MKKAQQYYDVISDSALQLYKMAYQLHYEEENIKEACRLYRQIIKQFPDSNEAAYAVIQLEKIGANEAIKLLNGGSFNKFIPLAALLVSLFALFIAATALLLALEKSTNSWYNIEDASSQYSYYYLLTER